MTSRDNKDATYQDNIDDFQDNKDNSDLLEIYKLHSLLSDRVSQRRDGANRFYAGLLTFVGISMGAIYKMDHMAFGGLGFDLLRLAEFTGLWLSVCWLIAIKSYQNLNKCKFEVLQDLEQELPYHFFRREWKKFEKGRYLSLTKTEMLPASCFLLLFLVLFLRALFQMVSPG